MDLIELVARVPGIKDETIPTLLIANIDGLSQPLDMQPLTEEDRLVINEFVNESSQKQMAGKRALINSLLAIRYGTTPEYLSRGIDSFGRPYYYLPLCNKPPIVSFNLSSSGGLVALGVSKPFIGIDIEIKPTEPRVDWQQVVDRFFLKTEAAFIRSSANLAQQYFNFLYVWTRKEACLKALGLGLHGQLQSVDVLQDKLFLVWPSGYRAEVSLVTHSTELFYLSWAVLGDIAVKPIFIN